MPEIPHLSDAEWLEAVRGAHFKRAEFYYRIFVEMREALGEEKALELIAGATKKAGLAQGDEYRSLMKENTPAAFCHAFCTHAPVGAKLFEMEKGPVEGEGEEQTAVACLGRCALVEGWKKMGVPDEEIAKLCRASRQTDYGKVEALGLEGEFTELLSEGGACCRMEVRKKKE